MMEEMMPTPYAEVGGPTGSLESFDVTTVAMTYDLDDVVTRFALEHDAPIEVVKELERELKRFLTLCSLNPQKDYGMAGPVDELWHAFIVDTKRYRDFCAQVAGRFVHHVPGSTEGALAGYVQFLDDYERFFGESAPVHAWPRPAREGDLMADCRGPAGCSPKLD